MKHKSLIYIPKWGTPLLDNSNTLELYYQKLLNLYTEASGLQRELHFVGLNSKIIKDATYVTNQIIFEVTEKCNLSCIYCGYGENYVRTYDERCQHMNWQTAKTVLDYYIRLWQVQRPKLLKKPCFIGFYGGEPLLNMPLIKRIIDYLEEFNEDLSFHYSMTTNGILLKSHIDYLVEKNFVLAVSMDGDSEMNSYRVYHNGKNIYEDLYSNLKYVKVKYPDYFRDHVEFISVATNRNTDEGINAFFEREYGKKSQINPLLSDQVADYEKWNLMRRKTQKRSTYLENMNYLSEFIENFSGNYYQDYRSLLSGSSEIVKTPTGTCLPFSLRTFITVKNDIIVCERVGFNHIVGKVTEHGVIIDFDSIAKFYNNIYNKFKSQCEKCYIVEVCNVCFLANQKYFKDSFICEDFFSTKQLKECIARSIIALRSRDMNFGKLISYIL